MCSGPILGYPRQNGKYILDTDASNVGIGGVLSQIQEGQERVLSNASKKLDVHQARKPFDSTDTDWGEFKENVDDVTELGNEVRAVTRSQTKDSVSTCQWIEGYSTQDISNTQREDIILKQLHEWMDKGCIPSRDSINGSCPEIRKYWINWLLIERRNDVLYMRKVSSTKIATYLLLVLEKLRKKVLDVFHSNVTAGHFGVSKKTMKIKERFYWYKMRECIRLYIQNCERCNKVKQLRSKPKAALHSYLAH
ncbi:hypothetical protein FSP39_011111 [Pinctada imbricata]|uniref:Integrase zinc-binding domain-containing protein n=1 Tax=Pinctada imbricata TaxID=66713 RepID=A0AA89C3U3_PINIB|nr:hypothetical protein FSP39_011111 [Pinctada imbricata]